MIDAPWKLAVSQIGPSLISDRSRSTPSPAFVYGATGTMSIEQAGKIAEHGLSRPASPRITTRSERLANPQRRPSSSQPSVRLRRAKYGLSQRRRHPEGLGRHWGLQRF